MRICTRTRTRMRTAGWRVRVRTRVRARLRVRSRLCVRAHILNLESARKALACVLRATRESLALEC